MPTIYIRKDLYDEIVKKGDDVTVYVNENLERILRKTDLSREYAYQ